MRLLLPLILALATCWASNPLLESVPPQPIQAVSGDYRLPKDVTPTKYEIDLAPVFDVGDNSKSFRFDGHSKIALDVKTATNKIVFHSKNLVIDDKNSYLTGETKEDKFNISIKFIKYDTIKECVELELEKQINVSNESNVLNLILTYGGNLKNDDLHGFYRSSYQDEQNNTRWLATTQFEPTGARKAFPCWDEPAIKATFKIKIKPPSDNYHVLSNTMNTKDKDKEGYVQFEETPKMSTYLVAFVVSDFVNSSEKDYFRVWSKPTPQNYREFALKFGQKALKQLENFTGFNYTEKSITKMDQIAIPQFSAGAMENWGLVTYRESSLLYNKEVDTTETKQNIATTIAHEFAHQWFGNKVTCNWWSSIWLNEGFATFFEYYIPDQIEEKEDGVKENWRLMEQFVTRALQATAFVVDANNDTRALTVVENSIQTPQQISSLFDSIAYQKGGCILRMMQQFLTEESFKSGLHKYVENNAFKSVAPEDLFTAIYESQKNTISKLLPESTTLNEVMKNWVYNPGYPVVTVERNDTHVTLTQERFLLDSQQDDAKWYIPIIYFTENLSSNEKTLWMKPTDKYLSLKVDDLNIKDKWILFNKNQTGYYRVNYDDASWNRLAKYLDSSEYYQNISAISRSQLIDDASNLARAGHTSYNNSLSITVYLRKETDYIPWYASYRAFDVLYNLLWGTKSHDKLISYVAKTADAFVKKHDYKQQNGTHVERLAKVLALKLACKYKVNGDHVTYAKSEFQKWLNNTKIWSEIKNEVLCAGLQDADEATVEKVLNKYNVAQGTEQTAILKGLGCNTKEKNIKQLLATSINKTSTIKVNVFDAMSSIYSGNPGSFDVLIEFIQQNITQIKEVDTIGTGLAAILNNLATRVKTDAQFSTLASFAHRHLKTDQKMKTLNSALNNLQVIKFYLDEASAWLEEKTRPEPITTPPPDSASSITLTSILVIIPVLLARFN